MAKNVRPVLIIDGLNLFIRSWAAYPTMSTNGYQMGGCIGFMKTLRRLINEQNPSSVYVIWEGGGSNKRRALYSEYKMNRKPEKLNRFYEDDIPDTDDNKTHQVTTLLSLLKCAPVCQIYVPDCEGDDVIAYMCRNTFKDVDKVIASSDKDMLQLLDERTKVYSLHRKKYITIKDVLDEYRVTPDNFALAKALCGDPSDNIPGVKGVGFKTVARVLPFLGSDEHLILQDVFDYCHTHASESVIYRRILENEDDVRRNWRLVFLDESTLSPTQASKVDAIISTPRLKVDRMKMIKILVKEGINDFDVEGFLYVFNGMNWNVDGEIDE
jgi:5'-3' exonuclease